MANSGGGRAGIMRVKNSAMAADLKKRGVKRETMRCPVCNRIVSVIHFPSHLNMNTCK